MLYVTCYMLRAIISTLSSYAKNTDNAQRCA